MDFMLNDIEARVLGCLIEKEKTTPDYYPLTLNSLCVACNQKSNRHPVVTYEETTVVRGLDGLRDKHLAEKVHLVDSRLPKYRHLMQKKLELSEAETAILCELLLRGPQTTGELRGRADRMHSFSSIDEVETVMKGLEERDAPLIIKLPRQVGQKERRYIHLLCGEPLDSVSTAELPEEDATKKVRDEGSRISRLESEISQIRADIDQLKKTFDDWRKQFE
ncbi:MAG: YceH family protein [Nitrospirae bacterium]|nr:YceH family protein [Nitrospirota bacterium]